MRRTRHRIVETMRRSAVAGSRRAMLAASGLALVLVALLAAADAELTGPAACAWLESAAPGTDCERAWQKAAAARIAGPPVPVRSILLQVKPQQVETSGGIERLLFRPRADTPPWPVAVPVDWSADPFDDRNWRFQLSAWRMIDPLLAKHARKNAAGQLQRAVALVLDWADFHIVRGRSHEFAWYDMAAGLRAAKLAYILDRGLRGAVVLDGQQKEMLLRIAYLHVDRLTDPDFLAENNHGLFQVHGLLALCSTVPSIHGCGSAKTFAGRKMQELLQGQFTAEGVHREHSPEYHFFATRNINKMLASGWYAEFEATRSLMELAEANKVWLVMPDGAVPRVGDSLSATSSLQLPEGDPRCASTAVFKPACYIARAFPMTGYGIVRSDWAIPPTRASMLFLSAGYHSDAHKHSDDLSFEWFEAGMHVLTDAGKYGYNDDRFRRYALSTRAHNTVEIDGQDFPRDRKSAYGSALKRVARTGWGFILEASVRHETLGTLHRRQLLYRPREWLVVMDNLQADEPRDFVQWFHFEPGIDVTGSGRDYAARLPNGGTLRVEQLASNCPGKLIRGQEEPRLQGWTSAGYLKMVPNPALGFACSGTEVTLVTVLSTSKQARSDALMRLRDLN